KGDVLFLRPGYYSFHDEWFMFELFNGRTVPGFSQSPYADLKMATPRELQTYLRSVKKLPDGFTNENGRIIAKNFYSSAASDPRVIGLGSFIYSHNAKREGKNETILAFDMVFNDQPSEADVNVFNKRIEAALNRTDIKWLPRSQSQEALAIQLSTQEKWKNKVAFYEDFIIPGEVTFYSGKMAAGKLKYFPKGKYDPTSVKPEDILLLEELPDDVPPVRGIVTSVPQTALAHINLLSKGRGTLNVFVADRKLFNSMKARVSLNKWVGLGKNRQDNLVVRDLSGEEYQKYSSFSKKKPSVLPSIDWKSLSYIYELEKLPTWKDSQIIRAVGGKNFGMAQLIKANSPHPPNPFSISVKGYREHIEQGGLNKLVESTLRDSRFVKDEKIQFLVLEGPKEFKKRFPDLENMEPYKSLQTADKSSLGQIIYQKGLKGAIEALPLSKQLEVEVLEKIKTLYSEFPKGQGMRFRSSSDLEDIPGFVGAGLYDSYTGFVDPAQQTLNEGDKKKTIPRAIKKTWASYWNYRAFKERELAKLDHLSGSMAIMAHPNFPEETEKANGVLTVALRPGGEFSQYIYDVEINVNYGEISVARPDGSLNLPQQIQLNGYVKDIAKFEKQNIADMVMFKKFKPDSNGVVVISKEQALDATKKAVLLVANWLENINKPLPAEWKNNYYKLDIEFKLVPEGWLKDSFNNTGPNMIVLKQGRPLIKHFEGNMKFQDQPIPRSLLSEATSILKRTVQSEYFDFETVEVYEENTPYDGAFNAYVQLKWKKDWGQFKAGTTTRILHHEYISGHGFMHHGPWDLGLGVNKEALSKHHLRSLNLYESGSFRVIDDQGKFLEGTRAKVHTEEWLESADTWLTSLLAE
ncbi:MAG: PEP/pyruvate-binding domain-containing protein, partial [Pseudobdellovibrionaceae bacterium]